MLHTVRAQQLIKSDIGTVWAFISDPRNLGRITPPYMRFQVLGNELLTGMYPGQIIEYHVRPVLGVRLHWVTEITHVEPGKYFVDEQRFGPYAFWHHKHFVRQTPGGVEMTDLVHYKLPLGLLGRWADAAFVRRQLQGIFDYRYEQVEKIFNVQPPSVHA